MQSNCRVYATNKYIDLACLLTGHSFIQNPSLSCPNTGHLWDNFDNKGQKVCCKVSLYKNCQRQSCSAINCLSSGITILAGGSSVPLISECKGTDPQLQAGALLIPIRQVARPSVGSCVVKVRCRNENFDPRE